MKNISIISENLKKLRSEKMLSQEELANKLNVTRQTISNWENGKSLPDAEQINNLANTYGIDVDKILNEKIYIKERNSKNKKNSLFVLVIINIIITATMLILIKNSNPILFGKAIIFSGTPLIITITVWFVLENALKNNNFTLIGGYNDKYKYNYKILVKIIEFIQGYVVIISIISNVILTILVCIPNTQEYYVYLFFVYLINFFAGIVYVNIKYKDRLYINDAKQ